MQVKTLIGLASIGAASAAFSGYLLRRKPNYLRYAVSGASFLIPFGIYSAVKSAFATTILFVSDTHDTRRDVSTRIAQAMLTEPGVDLVVHGGDVADENCTLYDAWWDTPYAAVRERWNVIGVNGNHDNVGCFTQRFGTLPRKVTVNDVDFFLLPWGGGSTSLQWLDAETAASTARWKVLVAHKGAWQVSANEGRIYGPSAELSRILMRIDLVLAGHNHVFWDSTHIVGNHNVRQIIEVTSGKFYKCVPSARECVEGVRGFSRIAFTPDGIRVERRVVR